MEHDTRTKALHPTGVKQLFVLKKNLCLHTNLGVKVVIETCLLFCVYRAAI